MVIVEKIPKITERRVKESAVSLGMPPRDTIENRRLLAKLRRIVLGEEVGLEALAALEHDQWAGWMRYLFDRSSLNPDGSVTIPAELVRRWGRQMRIEYEDLPAGERESDRVEARKVLSLNWLKEDGNARHC